MLRIAVLLLSPVLLAPTLAAAAPQAERQSAAQLAAVVKCRTLTDNQERLACYDREVAALDSSQAKGDIVVVDRQQLKQAHRALFGLNTSALSFVTGHRDDDAKSKSKSQGEDEDDVKEITATVRAVGHNNDGGVVLTLEDGARWEQTNSTLLGRQPKPGSSVTITRAAFGSFKMKIDNGPTMRARRVN